MAKVSAPDYPWAMVRGLALAVLLLCAQPRAARAELDAPPPTSTATPTVVVFPLDVKDALSDLGFALGLRTLGVLRAAGGTNLVHPKMLERVVGRYEHLVARLPPHQRRARLGEVLGTDYVVHGTLDERRSKLEITVAEVPSGQVLSRVRARVRNFESVLNALPETTMAALQKAGVLIGVAVPDPTFIAPSTRYRQAMLDHAACHRALIRQPLGISRPIVVDQSAILLAMDFCQEALDRDPDFESARADLALAHAFLDEKREAERMLINLREAPAILPMYWLARFWVLSRYYDPALALESLERALEVHPGFMLGRGYLGEALLAMGRPEEAIEVFRTYLERCPRQSYVMAQIGVAASRAGRPSLGIEWTERALEVTPNDPELLAKVAARQMDAGLHDAARNHLEEVIARGGARGRLHLQLGRAHLALGELPLAERQIRQAIAKSPGARGWRTRGRARYELARLWTRAKSPANAIRQLRQALLEGYLDLDGVQDRVLAPLQRHRDYNKLRRTKPRTGAAPTFVSPLGRVSSAARLELRTRFERRTDRKILERL